MSNSTAAHRKLVLKISVSLDGFVCGPNGEVDWVFTTIGGADSADWILNTLRGAGTHIMGSRSYKDMAAFWPFSDLPIAAPMNEIPKVIFSRTGIEDGTKMSLSIEFIPEGDGTRLELRQGPFPEEMREMSAVGWNQSFYKLEALLATPAKYRNDPADYDGDAS